MIAEELDDVVDGDTDLGEKYNAISKSMASLSGRSSITEIPDNSEEVPHRHSINKFLNFHTPESL